MKVILGLGNPGKEYEQTRHNVGWWVLDHLADVWRFDGWKRDGKSAVAQGLVGATKVRLVKPLTFMNLSGGVLVQYARRPFWAAKTDLLVISDEVALPVGAWRFRESGSAGGHNGLKSIQSSLGTMEYPRLRIGVRALDENRMRGDLADFVLGAFGRDEAAAVREQFDVVTRLVERWLADGAKGANDVQSQKR